jgi:formylglycine-generating enzyme required for sulfatase activity
VTPIPRQALVAAVVSLVGCSHRAVPPGDGGSPAVIDSRSVADARAQRPDAPIKPFATFTMGSPADEPCRHENEDQHQVTLMRRYEIEATEVTQQEFQALMGYNPATFKSCGGDCPVETVSWHEALAYCNALSLQKGLTRCYQCSGTGPGVTCKPAPAFGGQKIYTCPGFRLPTEAEWEHAYRAGTKTAYYSGANDPASCSLCSADDKGAGAIAWYCANADSKSHQVGQKQRNPLNLFDMAGNVWEWCHDRYKHWLGSAPVVDPAGPPSGVYRVVRGGSWGSNPENLRAAQRSFNRPTFRAARLGFRCARTR